MDYEYEIKFRVTDTFITNYSTNAKYNSIIHFLVIINDNHIEIKSLVV